MTVRLCNAFKLKVWTMKWRLCGNSDTDLNMNTKYRIYQWKNMQWLGYAHLFIQNSINEFNWMATARHGLMAFLFVGLWLSRVESGLWQWNSYNDIFKINKYPFSKHLLLIFTVQSDGKVSFFMTSPPPLPIKKLICISTSLGIVYRKWNLRTMICENMNECIDLYSTSFSQSNTFLFNCKLNWLQWTW